MKTIFDYIIYTLLTFTILNYAYSNKPEWTVYNMYNSGLPDNQVTSIIIEENGTKWIGTWDGGLASYDGNNWTVYNTTNSGLPVNRVRALAIDSLGNKWIGTLDGGLVSYDGTNWTIYNTENSGLPHNRIWSISIDVDGNKWIGTSDGLVKYDNSNWIIYNTENSGLPINWIYSIAIEKCGTKWIGTRDPSGSDGGLIKYDDTNWTKYNTENSDLPDNRIESITIDENGVKWIGTGDHWGQEGGLVKFDGTNWTVYSTFNSDLPDNLVNCIEIDEIGIKWIGTFDGLANFDNTNWIVYTTGNSSLPYNYISSISIDVDGNKWIGTFGGGVAVYKQGKITTEEPEIPVLASPEDGVENISVDTVLVWKASERGESYKVQVSTESDFSVLVADSSGITDLFYEIDGLEGLTTYHWRVRASNESGNSEWSTIWHFTTYAVSSVKRFSDGFPDEFILEQNYPNPFNPATIIRYGIPQRTHVNLTVYNSLGQKVATIVNEEQEAQYYETVFDASGLPSGVYVYRMQAGEYVEVKKLLYLK